MADASKYMIIMQRCIHYIAMQTAQLTQEQLVVAEALQLINTLKGSQKPVELEVYVQTISKNQDQFEGLMQAVENQELDDNSIKMLCMLISKVLNAGNLQESVQLKAFMRLALNWSLPQKSKQMVETELRKFIKTISGENMNYLYLIVKRLQQLINDISEQRQNKAYESSPIEMDGLQLTIVVNFPEQFVPMVQTYLLLVQSVLYIKEGFQFMLQLTQNFHFLKIIHLLIFEPKNVIAHPSLFGSLFQFWSELLELFFSISKLQEFIDIIEHLEYLTVNINSIYEALCVSGQEGTDYLQMEDHQNAASIMKLKAQVCEFHTTLLSHMLNNRRKSPLLQELSVLFPSIVRTTQKYLATKKIYHDYDEFFIKSLLPLLSITIQVTAISEQNLLNIMVTLAIPYLSMGIQNAQLNQIDGEELHSILDDCCELSSSGDMISIGAQLMDRIFQKESSLLGCFYELVQHTLSQRYRYQQEQYNLGKLEKPLDLRIAFLGLSLSAYHDHQTYDLICGEMTQLLSKQFLQSLTVSEMEYFFHFLDYSWIMFYEKDSQKLTMLIEYALSPEYYKKQSIEFFALEFLFCVFQELYNEQWLLNFIAQMPIYKSGQSIRRKWNIFHDIVIKNIIDFDTNSIVWIIQNMKVGASRELERMENQKKLKYKAEYGEVYQYLASLKDLQKTLGRAFMRKEILESLLDFVGLVDRAGHLNLQKELLKLAINLFPLCHSKPELIAKGLKVMQKILITFVQQNYKGNYCLLAIFSGINAFKNQGKFVSSTLLKILQFGSQFIVKNYSNMDKDILQRILVCLLCLMQKYWITFQVINQDKNRFCEILQRIGSVCDYVFQNPQTSKYLLAAKYHVTNIIYSLLVGGTVNWQQLRVGSREGWFLNYDAFIILHTFGLIIAQFDVQTKKILLQIGLQLLTCHEMKQLQDDQTKKDIKIDLYKKKEPLQEMHRTVDAFMYEKNMVEQVWLLFDSCNIKNWNDCVSIFPTFSHKCFDYLLFFRCRSQPKTQQEYLDYTRVKFSRTKEVQKQLSTLGKDESMMKAQTRDDHIACQRKIYRVTGDRVDNIENSYDDKTCFKRNIFRHFVDKSSHLQDNYSESILYSSDQQIEEQSNKPRKKLIDNYFTQHRAIRRMVNMSSTDVINKKEERYGQGRREKMQRIILTADMKRLTTTAQDQL